MVSAEFFGTADRTIRTRCSRDRATRVMNGAIHVIRRDVGIPRDPIVRRANR